MHKHRLELWASGLQGCGDMEVMAEGFRGLVLRLPGPQNYVE